MDVIELFAGVGGFRVGLERASRKYKVIWSNQWEPASKAQDASKIYQARFPRCSHSNEDIATVPTESIPDHDLLVGGFPCQDYSVARTLNQATGLVGKKGVLWWQIHRIIAEKKKKPDYILLENVDRLLKSPASQRGRDFAIMLSSLSELGYIVEWRVINAADYGMPQRRRRVFIFGYRKKSVIGRKIHSSSALAWISKNGVVASAFKLEPKTPPVEFELSSDLAELSKNFNKGGVKSKFANCGIIIDGTVTTFDAKPVYSRKRMTLGDVLQNHDEVPESYYIDPASLKKWKYLKGAKNEQRTNKSNGFAYKYNEGSMVFPDPLDKPSRTIVTGEGGSAPSRFKHVIETPDGRLRRLTPIELEKLNMFDENHTLGASDIKRAFIMGNALVVGVVTALGESLLEHIKDDQKQRPSLRQDRRQVDRGIRATA